MSDDFQQRGGSPWGTPPGGGSGNGSGKGPIPPDIDKIIREFQEKIKKFLPGGSSSGGKQAVLVLIILGFVWLASGLYRVLPDEQGVVLRFGKFVKTTQPGLNYHIPFPDPLPLPPPGGVPQGLPPRCWKSSDIHYLYSVLFSKNKLRSNYDW